MPPQHTSVLFFAKTLRANMTSAEKRLWFYLRSSRLINFKFRRQMPIYPYIVDFICLSERLIIELDGSQHQKPNARRYDQKRTDFLEKKGFRVIRFSNNEVLENTKMVLESILNVLMEPPHPPVGTFSRKGRRHSEPPFFEL